MSHLGTHGIPKKNSANLVQLFSQLSEHINERRALLNRYKLKFFNHYLELQRASIITAKID